MSCCTRLVCLPSSPGIQDVAGGGLCRRGCLRGNKKACVKIDSFSYDFAMIGAVSWRCWLRSQPERRLTWLKGDFKLDGWGVVALAPCPGLWWIHRTGRF